MTDIDFSDLQFSFPLTFVQLPKLFIIFLLWFVGGSGVGVGGGILTHRWCLYFFGSEG